YNDHCNMFATYTPFIQKREIRESVIEPEEKDSWSYIWGNSTYSSAKLYHYTFKNQRNNFIFDRGRLSFLGWNKEFCAEKSTLFSSF
ncbi:hypothetical protein ACJX0J_022328, partial [Zea mays]